MIPWVSPKSQVTPLDTCMRYAQRCSSPRIQRASFPCAIPSTLGPLVGTKPWKVVQGVAPNLHRRDLVTSKTCPRHPLGQAPWSCPVSKALVKIGRSGSGAAIASCTEPAVWNGKLVKSRSGTGEWPPGSRTVWPYDVVRWPEWPPTTDYANARVSSVGEWV